MEEPTRPSPKTKVRVFTNCLKTAGKAELDVNNRRGLTYVLLVLLACLIAAGASFQELSGVVASANDDAADGAWRELGEAVFVKNCAACHGMTGEGMPGVFPALAGNEFIVGDAKAVVRVPMNGRGGMPRFADTLSDEEIAAVLSYVRNAWGNEAEPITPELVAEVRKEK